jgi:starch phosphorylase
MQNGREATASERSDTMDVMAAFRPIDQRGLDEAALARSIFEKLVYAVGRDPDRAVNRDWGVALSLAVRDRIVDCWMPSIRRDSQDPRKRVYYLSMEFLIGRLLRDAMANLGIIEQCRAALATFGVDFDEVLESEPDAALGNGGLGRLAACFLESLARVGIAAYGYGIRYEHGLFRQSFRDGWQAEDVEDWLTMGHPWEFERPEILYPIGFGGVVESGPDGRPTWRPSEQILAKAYDTPIPGWQGEHVNTLRLWSAQPSQLLDLDRFNRGKFLEAAERRVVAETISRILYPNDSTPEGQELRLKQEYFFTSASLQDLVRRFLQEHGELASLSDHVAIQLNDTHPAIAVPELILLLVDRHGMSLDTAIETTRGCISYTNHTLLPEALECWPLGLFGSILPRHLEIIEQLNDRFLATLPVTTDRREVGIIADHSVRMGHLAFIGSHKINGVSALHTELMKRTVFRGLHSLFPDRIVNQTNGITPRRWLYECNPGLARLVSDAIGDQWVADLERIEALAGHADDPAFRAAFADVKLANKERLADEIRCRLDIAVDPRALFDIHIKRIHEYKRQLLNILEAVALYRAIRDDPYGDWQPRVKIFAGKAAPSYVMAKLTIKLINDVAQVVNADPLVGDRLKIVFLPNYNVSLAEVIIPAADLSEQISTAGMEASGTGNMKLAVNGALTVGTLDGANIEIRERVGDDNIFIFGLTAEEVMARRADGYRPHAEIEAQPALQGALQEVAAGGFAQGGWQQVQPLLDDLWQRDHFMVAADFAAYAATQRRIDHAFADHTEWTRRAVLNTARVGWFSSDRAIRGYARDIWQVPTG